jgi:hypothetical protein
VQFLKNGEDGDVVLLVWEIVCPKLVIRACLSFPSIAGWAAEVWRCESG